MSVSVIMGWILKFVFRYCTVRLLNIDNTFSICKPGKAFIYDFFITKWILVQ